MVIGIAGLYSALLILAESKGANLERDLILSKNLPVYYSIDEVPL